MSAFQARRSARDDDPYGPQSSAKAYSIGFRLCRRHALEDACAVHIGIRRFRTIGSGLSRAAIRLTDS